MHGNPKMNFQRGQPHPSTAVLKTMPKNDTWWCKEDSSGPRALMMKVVISQALDIMSKHKNPISATMGHLLHHHSQIDTGTTGAVACCIVRRTAEGHGLSWSQWVIQHLKVYNCSPKMQFKRGKIATSVVRVNLILALPVQLGGTFQREQVLDQCTDDVSGCFQIFIHDIHTQKYNCREGSGLLHW
jgi:hypothetical protein